MIALSLSHRHTKERSKSPINYRTFFGGLPLAWLMFLTLFCERNLRLSYSLTWRSLNDGLAQKEGSVPRGTKASLMAPR